MKAANFRQRRINAKYRELLPKLREKFGEIKAHEKHWEDKRIFADYNVAFRFGSGHDIVHEMKGMHSTVKRKLRILEDGSGGGQFIGTLKSVLESEGIPSETTATTLHDNYFLSILKKEGLIDNVVKGAMELYVPERPVDAIFSMMGSVNYTIGELRKDHALKLANSLAPHGFMLVAFGFEDDKYSIKGGLSKKPKPKNVDTQTYFKGIEKAFAKHGFLAKIYRLRVRGSPNFGLLVKRANPSRT
ncbi:MAG TPA: hypothetical protein VJH23_01790 [archaeon]|nr:hypothetical protein [archaeon]